jgi:hypothetical protein
VSDLRDGMVESVRLYLVEQPGRRQLSDDAKTMELVNQTADAGLALDAV